MSIDSDEERTADTTDFGYADVDRNAKQGMVDAVFDRVARRYDLMNDLMSGGMHRLWKRALVDWLAPPRRARSPFTVLDMAGGTGDVAFRIARRSAATEVTIADISPAMLDIGRARARRRRIAGQLAFVDANAESLPFADRSFDAYVIAFGIRNVPRIDAALTEAARVLKRGGRFLCLEFSQVDLPGLDRLYELYSFRAIPRLGRIVAGDAESYRYLVESIRRFPDQTRFAGMIGDAGLDRVTWRNLSGGIAAIHSAWKL